MANKRAKMERNEKHEKRQCTHIYVMKYVLIINSEGFGFSTEKRNLSTRKRERLVIPTRLSFTLFTVFRPLWTEPKKIRLKRSFKPFPDNNEPHIRASACSLSNEPDLLLYPPCSSSFVSIMLLSLIFCVHEWLSQITDKYVFNYAQSFSFYSISFNKDISVTMFTSK